MVAGASISVAHGVVSKDGVSDQKAGVERVSNQLGWFCQQKFGFPVPAQSDYRNILSSLNST